MKRAVIAAVAVAAVLLGCVGLSTAQQQPYVYNDAYRSQLLTRASFCDPAVLRQWSCGRICSGVPGFQPDTLLQSTDNEAFGYIGVDRRNRQIAVVFRATRGATDWLQRYNHLITSYSTSPGCGSGCQVHRDTFTSYSSMRPQMYAALMRLIRAYPGYQVLVTGYSLGGAFALLAAVDLQEQFNYLPTRQRPIALYTFGAPRVGNPTFTRWAGGLLKGPHYRVVHAGDAVPQMPPVRLGYLHVPTEVYYGSNYNSSMRVCVDSVTAESSSCSGAHKLTSLEYHLWYLGNPAVCVSMDPRTAAVEQEVPDQLPAHLRSLLSAASTSSDGDV